MTPELKGQFQALSDELGMSDSELGAYVLGNFLKTQREIRLSVSLETTGLNLDNDKQPKVT
jgi:hypothetical protein